MPKDRFSVYSVASLMCDEDNPESEPRACEGSGLNVHDAIAAAVKAAERVSVGRVIVVTEADDTIGWDWRRSKGLTFPPNHAYEDYYNIVNMRGDR